MRDNACIRYILFNSPYWNHKVSSFLVCYIGDDTERDIFKHPRYFLTGFSPGSQNHEKEDKPTLVEMNAAVEKQGTKWLSVQRLELNLKIRSLLVN